MRQLATQRRQRFSQVHDGVVVVGHRAVSRATLSYEVDVGATLLRYLTGVDRLTIDEDGETACFIDAKFGVQPFRVFLQQPGHSVSTPHLLVGSSNQNQVALQRQPIAMCHQQHLQVNGGGQLRVDGAAPVENAVRDLPGEGWMAPARGLGGHHIEMRHHEQRPLGTVAAQAHRQASPVRR